MDKLKKMKRYAWGHAVYSFLLQSISSHSEGTTKYVSGCTVGLLVRDGLDCKSSRSVKVII